MNGTVFGYTLRTLSMLFLIMTLIEQQPVLERNLCSLELMRTHSLTYINGGSYWVAVLHTDIIGSD